MLHDGREFLLGDPSPSALDITVYYQFWSIKNSLANETKDLWPENGQSRLVSWLERIAALDHGTSKDITSLAAFDVAKQAEPIEPKYIDNKNKSEWHVG